MRRGGVLASLHVSILFSPVLSLSHTHTHFRVHVWHVFVDLSRVNCRVAATYEQQTRFLNSILSASAHHLLPGNLLATHTHGK